MGSWISRGQCQKCGAREVIAHRGRYHQCKRCNPELWNEVANQQKDRFLTTGTVHEKKVQK